MPRGIGPRGGGLSTGTPLAPRRSSQPAPVPPPLAGLRFYPRCPGRPGGQSVVAGASPWTGGSRGVSHGHRAKGSEQAEPGSARTSDLRGAPFLTWGPGRGAAGEAGHPQGLAVKGEMPSRGRSSDPAAVSGRHPSLEPAGPLPPTGTRPGPELCVLLLPQGMWQAALTVRTSAPSGHRPRQSVLTLGQRGPGSAELSSCWPELAPASPSSGSAASQDGAPGPKGWVGEQGAHGLGLHGARQPARGAGGSAASPV